MLLSRSKKTLTKDFALVQSTFRVLRWLKDGDLPDVSFDSVAFRTGQLPIDSYRHTGLPREDLTIEARIFENSLRELETINPDDFH